MKIIAMIPARYGASRFPGKLMANLDGKTVIARTYEATQKTQLFDAVYVVTDSQVIKEEILKHGGNVILSQKEHECGTDRIAEAVENIEVDIVVNVQGDEPFVNKKALENLLNVFKEDAGTTVDVASLMQEIKEQTFVHDPNYVKVAVDNQNKALFFSRSPIPFLRDKTAAINHYEHIGVYAFRKQALLDFYRLPMLPLEKAEKIECLRFLEYGKTLKMVVTNYMGVEIDTPEDLEAATQYLKNNKI